MESPAREVTDPARLAALRASGLLDAVPEESFDRLTRLAARILSAPVALVSLVDAERQVFKSQVGLGEPWATSREMPLSHSYCQYVVRDRAALVVSDARAHPELAASPSIPELDAIAYAGVPLRTGEGQVLGSFCVVDHRPRGWSDAEVEALRDLAACAETEIELRHESAEARRLAEIVRSSEDAIVTAGTDGTVTSWNRGAERLFGWPAEEMVGAPLARLLPRGAADDLPALLARMERGERLHHFEAPRVRRDGETVAVSLTLSPLPDAGGTLAGVSLVARDVSARQAVERMKDEFVSVVSHELRTPLTSIRGSLGLLASGKVGTLPERGARMLEIARGNAERLARLIDEVLDVERIASGRIDLRPEPLRAGALLEGAAEAMHGQAEAAGVELVVEAGSAELSGDRDRLGQVLANLVGNAVKFSPPGGRVELAARRVEEGVRFEVRDRGRGIPAEAMGRLFRRFEQVDPSDARDRGGSGLGLYISRQIVEAHGGRIWAESEPGRGSTFAFVVP